MVRLRRMLKRKREVRMKSTNNPLLHNASESSAPEIVNHQQADMHAPANQRLKGSLSKNVPQRQRSKEGLQTSATDKERINTDDPSWSQFRSRSRLPTRKSKVTADTSHSEVITQQASCCSQLKPQQHSRKRMKSKITANTTDAEVIPQQASCCSHLKQRSHSQERMKSKTIANTTDSEVIPQQASCCSQLKPRQHSRERTKSKITANTTDAEVIPLQASCCLHLKQRSHSQERVKSKTTANTTDSEVIPQQASCCLQLKPRTHSRKRKKSKITDDSTDSEVIPRRASRFYGQSRRNNSQKGLDSTKFQLYLESIWKLHPEDRRNAFTYLDSLWFFLYSEHYHKAKALNWIAEKKIFSKEYVFVPIVLWGHWSLLIFCHLGESLQSKERSPCMLLLDSLHMANPERFEPGIRKFVIDLFKVEQRPETKDQIRKIPLLIPKVPQQRSDDDCGNFVLYYINLFLESAPENFSISKGYPYFMTEDWFTLERLECFFQEVQSTASTCISDECLLDDGDVVCIDPPS